MDAPVELASLALLWFAARIVDKPDEKRNLLHFAFAGAFGLTFKESMPIQWVLTAVWLAWVLGVRRGDWRGVGWMLGTSVGAAAVAIIWMARVVGGLDAYFGALTPIPRFMATQSYSAQCCGGPPWMLPLAMFVLSPLVASLAVIGLWKLKSPLHRGMAAICGAEILVHALAPNLMNLRYIAYVQAPLALIAGLGIDRLYRKAGSLAAPVARRTAVTGVLLLPVFGGLSDYDRFQRYFNLHQLLDPGANFVVFESLRQGR